MPSCRHRLTSCPGGAPSPADKAGMKMSLSGGHRQARGVMLGPPCWLLLLFLAAGSTSLSNTTVSRENVVTRSAGQGCSSSPLLWGAVAVTGVTNDRGWDPRLPRSGLTACTAALPAAPPGHPAAGPPPAGCIIRPIVRASAQPQPIWRQDNGAFFRIALGGINSEVFRRKRNDL